MAVVGKLVADNTTSEPLTGKSVLICTHATTATSKLIGAVTALGASVTYVPVSYNGGGRNWSYWRQRRCYVGENCAGCGSP